MDELLARTIGSRVRSARTANRQTRVVVAGLTGITADYLYQIERGKKVPTIPVLTQLAHVLRVPVSQLLAEPDVHAAPHADKAGLGSFLTWPLTQPSTSHKPPPVSDVHEQVRAAWRVWQTSPHRYSETASRLPALIADVRAWERSRPTEDERRERRRVQACAVDLYGLLRTVAKRVGRADLSMLVADRAVQAAEAADDPYRLAAAQWNLAHVLLAEQEPAGAEMVARHAADALAPLMRGDDLDAVALCGALILLSAVAAVRQGEVWRGRERVREVIPMAKHTG
ncbi:MAG: helix-turn-helix domain-containing protein [Micromonosporaceae bacterium]